jgi:two-component system response regulator (stage 0 sporulation protein F)
MMHPTIDATSTDAGFDDEESLTAGRRPHVLVADDDDDMRALVANALRRDGYVVMEARTGAEALRVVHGLRRAPDAIVTDIRMPDLSGLALLAGLRDEGSMTPIVVMSAFATDQVRTVADELGADAIFGKPFDIDDLRTVVMNVLRPNNGPRAFATTLSDD